MKASVAIAGIFDKRDDTLAFTSTDVTTGVLDITIQADSVNTGSHMKDDKLKSKEFFNAEQDPLITFLSKKIVQTGPHTFDVQGDSTIPGASKAQTLTLTVSGKGTGSGEIHGTMVFDRKDYGMNKGIPFVRIGDSVDVTSRASEPVGLHWCLSNSQAVTLTASFFPPRCLYPAAGRAIFRPDGKLYLACVASHPKLLILEGAEHRGRPSLVRPGHCGLFEKGAPV